MSETPDDRFERDVPPEMRESLLERICECIASGRSDGPVAIIEHDRADAINARASGAVTIGDREFFFIAESGNWNGFELIEWEGGRKFKPYTHVRWALQPDPMLVMEAIAKGRGEFLVLKWDAVLKNVPGLAEVPGKYAYDRMVQPGEFVEKYWRGKAAEHQFILVSEDEAAATRARLLANQEGRQE